MDAATVTRSTRPVRRGIRAVGAPLTSVRVVRVLRWLEDQPDGAWVTLGTIAKAHGVALATVTHDLGALVAAGEPVVCQQRSRDGGVGRVVWHVRLDLAGTSGAPSWPRVGGPRTAARAAND